MSLQSLYRQLLLDMYISNQIKQGNAITSSDIESYLADTVDSLDLSLPQFQSEDYNVVRKEESSALKFNNGFLSILQDLRVLYKSMLELTQTSIEGFERWKFDVDILEKRLIDLENRIENLLLLSQDTEGFHSFFTDNFSDAYYVDRDLTDVAVDIDAQQVFIDPTLSSSTSTTRFFLNDLEDKSVFFKVRTTSNFIGRSDADDSKLTNIFSQLSSSWWTQIETKKVRPVTCELSVRLGDDPVDVSSIYIQLHDASQSGPMVITPLYSVDNYNFSQLPTNTYTQEVRSNSIFSFPQIQAKYIKFILTKQGPDPGIVDRFVYQFGFKEIGFYSETFTTGEAKVFVSRPISILDSDSNPKDFSRVVLEVCERIEEDTGITYFITPSNISTVPISSSTSWYPISPISRAEPIYPKVLNLGDLTETEIGDTETVTISYSGRATDTDYNNPAQSFRLLSLDTDGVILDEAISATAPRYNFVNSNDYILNYQIKDVDYSGSGTGTALDIDEDSMVILRNVGEKGLTENDTVRDIQKGWRFEDPYYVSVIEILNPEGMTIDVGDNVMIVDEVKYTNKISNSVL